MLAAHKEITLSLKLLADLRSQYKMLSSEQAAVLVSGLANAWTMPEDQTNALLLLSCWQPATRPGQLQEAVEAMTHCIAVPLPEPNLICAACLFLGSIVGDLQPVAADAAAATCLQGMQQAAGQLPAARLLPELLASCALMLPQLRAITGSWMLAAMLSLWCAPQQAPHPQNIMASGADLPGPDVSVEVMLPLYAALSSAGQSIMRQEAAHVSAAVPSQHWQSLDVAGMFELVTEALNSSCRRLQSAGCIAAAALLEAASQFSLSAFGQKRPAPLHALESFLSSITAKVAAEDIQPSWPRDNLMAGTASPDKQLLLDCLALSCSMSHQACGRPPAGKDLLICQQKCAWHSLLGLRQLHAAAAKTISGSAATQALRCQLDSPAAALLPVLLRSSTDAIRVLPASAIAGFWNLLRQASRLFFEEQVSLASSTSAAWMQDVDQALRNQALDQLYMTSIIWLTGLWDKTCQLAAAHPLVQGDHSIHSQDQASMAISLLDSIAYLQPAHIRLSIVSKAVSEALLHVSACPQAAEALLLCIPACSGRALSRGKAKQEQTVAGSLTSNPMMDRLQFLLQIAAPCLSSAPQAKAAGGAVSIALSLLHSPRRSASGAAHMFLISCLQDDHENEALAIAYMHEALQLYPTMTAEPALRHALETMLRSLPPSSLVPVLILRRLADALNRHQSGCLKAEAESPSLEWQALMGMLASSLLLISLQVLPDAVELMTHIVSALPPRHFASACQQLHDTIAASNDHARKTKLLRWYQANVDRHAQDKDLSTMFHQPAEHLA
ncbi:hypothetical protein WJX74_000363 [Apatococcus lobatus]|uniref:Uncharacterized protein n=1 Tax=Apatococcus lobatus TaxID=904363 RepID=A0AAW1Q5S9_9CHLO